MSKSTNRDNVHSTFSIFAESVVSNTARRFYFYATTYDFHCFTSVGRREVIKHNTVDTSCFKSFLQFGKRAHFYLNFKVFTFLFEIFLSATNSISNATSEVHVVVFQQNHIEKTDTVIASTTNSHSLFLQHAKSWRSFASVKHSTFSAFYQFHIFCSASSHTTHTLHDIQHEAFCLQQRLSAAFHYECHIAWFHAIAIFEILCHF